jgi:PPOX class probable F420-dependent enzyme
MAKQRDAVRMSDAEISAFLDTRKSMMVATLDKDGAPHQTVLWFAAKDGRYLFETYGTSQKVVNLRRDPRISLMWEDGTDYNELRGVTVTGKADIIDGGAELLDLMRVCVERNAPMLKGEALEHHVAHMAKKRVVVAVRPDKILSWDHRKLAALKSA